MIGRIGMITQSVKRAYVSRMDLGLFSAKEISLKTRTTAGSTNLNKHKAQRETTMNNSKLAKAVAWLLPEKDDIEIMLLVRYVGSAAYVALAFECHKAVPSEYEVSIRRHKNGKVTYLYFIPFKPLSHIEATSDTDEEAIFNCVQQAYDKREGV